MVVRFVAGLVGVLNFLPGLCGVCQGVGVALRATLLCTHEISLCIVRTSSSLSFGFGLSPKRSCKLSPSVMSMFVNFKDSMSEAWCQRPNVSDSMSVTQCQWLNVRDSMSASDLRTLSCIIATPHTTVYMLILVYERRVDLSCCVIHPWSAARSSVSADWLITASMSWVVFFSTQAQISLVYIEMPVGHLHATHGGAIVMVVWCKWGSLSAYEGRWVDMTVVKFTLIDLSA